MVFCFMVATVLITILMVGLLQFVWLNLYEGIIQNGLAIILVVQIFMLGLILLGSCARASVPQAACLTHPFLAGTTNVASAAGADCAELVRQQFVGHSGWDERAPSIATQSATDSFKGSMAIVA
jgi:hypothetical protein